MSLIGRWLDKIKAAAIVKFIAPYIKTVAPWVVSGLVAMGVDPALAEEFSGNLTAVAIVAVGFAIDFVLTMARKK